MVAQLFVSVGSPRTPTGSQLKGQCAHLPPPPCTERILPLDFPQMDGMNIATRQPLLPLQRSVFLRYHKKRGKKVLLIACTAPLPDIFPTYFTLMAAFKRKTLNGNKKKVKPSDLCTQRLFVVDVFFFDILQKHRVRSGQINGFG